MTINKDTTNLTALFTALLTDGAKSFKSLRILMEIREEEKRYLSEVAANTLNPSTYSQSLIERMILLDRISQLTNPRIINELILKVNTLRNEEVDERVRLEWSRVEEAIANIQ